MPSTTAFTIRRLTPEDAALMEAMMTVFGKAFEDLRSYTSLRPSHEYLWRLLARADFIALAALQEGAVVGGLAAYELQKFEQERSELYIYDLAVDLAHRRKGIATELITMLKGIGRSRGAYVIYVQADHGDAPAIALYTSLGTPEEVLHFDIGVE